MTDQVEDDVKLPSKEELLTTLEVEKPEEDVEVPETPQYSERESQAMSFGWLPKEQWIEKGGDPEDWRPAKDFLERGDMIGQIRALTKSDKENQAALRHVVAQQKKMYETGYTQAISDLKAERKVALQEGDLIKADELDDKIDVAKEALARVEREAVPKAQNQPDPEHIAWVEANPWYNNPVMMRFADALAIEYVRLNGASAEPSQVRDYVSKTVREEFKHRFEKAPVRAAPSPNGSGAQGSQGAKGGSSTNLSKIEAAMPEEHRAIMKVMIRTGMTKEEYLKMYESAR